MKRTLLLFAALLSLSTGVFAERATLDPAKGWTTTLTALPEDVSQYFFAIYDHDTEKAMVLAAGNHQGAGNKTMWYQTDVNPEKNKNAMWAFDGFDNNNYSGATGNDVTRLIITGVNNMDYCLQSYDGNTWNYRADNNGDGWTDRAYVIPSYGEISSGCWSLKNNKAGSSADCYIGHWDDDDEVAGNVNNGNYPARTGHFDFYAITRGQYVAVAEDIYSATSVNPIDISYVITNADATRKNNFHAAQPVGWKLSQDNAFECEFANYLPSKVGDSYFNKWQGSGNLTDRSMSQTVTGLPSGRYRLSVRTHSSVIAAGANLFANSDKTALNTVTESNVVSVTTTVTDGHLTFGVELKDYQSNNCKFDHFTLEYLGTDATASDYDALAAAITAFDNAVWGFETGEYAPYNNVEAINNIAAAKAIDPDGINSKLLVNLLTEKITLSAANVAEVNACAYGDFNTYETISGEDMPYGWNLYNGESNHSRIMGGTQGSENAGLAATSSGKALLLKWNSTYGESEGYTMPLKASTLYKITFKYCGWGGNTPQTHVVMTDPSGNDITLNPVFRPAFGDGQADASHWYSFTGYFVSSTAGNYKFNLNKVESGQQQIAIGDIELKTSNDVLLFSDAATMPTYAPGTYPTVRIERTISNEKWNTFVVPVSMDNPDGWEVMEMESFSSNTLSFTEASSIVAGQSYMVKPTDALTYFEVSNVAVTALETNDVTVNDVTMKGVYNSGATVPVSDETHTRYAVVGGELRKVSGNATVNIKPFRAYFEVQGVSQAREILLNFDEETAISFAEQWGGAERTQLEDGKYLIDGKIIIVNNGVKYSANGQILK